ncbi:putative transporter svop-1 [Bolinopsis microptera]|uniref:putative transporter svop-1 n=1 Tax=Bolinopsis microptera TaxID=2820187 RepID=UPI00307A8C8A
MTTLPHSYGTLNSQPPEEPNNCPNEHDSENTTRLSTIQIVALVAICLTHIGDAVEIYLPAILTQEISCDLLLSGTQQGLLSVVFYSFYAAGSFSSGWFANKIGRRITIIISLGLSFLVSTLAALSHEFCILLISRAATGVLVGSNYGITNLYWAEISPTVKIKNLGLLLASLCFSLGAGYTSLLAYYILHHVGWRTFFVLCSLPLFLFPLAAFIFYLPETDTYLNSRKYSVSMENGKDDGANEDLNPDKESGASNSLKMLIFLLSLTYLVNIAQGWGLILFVPEVYNKFNKSLGTNVDNCNAIFGYQYLKMSLISGLGPIGAKLGAYLVQMFAPLSVSMLCSSLVSTISFVLLATTHGGLETTDMFMGVIKAAFAYLNLSLWIYMMSTLDGPLKTIAIVIIDGSSKFGALFGSAAVAFLPVDTVIVIMSVLGVVQSVAVAFLCLKKTNLSE